VERNRPCPRKQSERCWKRFRKAWWIIIFQQETEFLCCSDTSYEDNLRQSLQYIDELGKFEPGADVQAAFRTFERVQRKWTDMVLCPSVSRMKLQ